MATALRDHKWRWQPGGGYYTARPEEYAHHPRLPDLTKRRDHDMARLFDAYLPRDYTPEVLELGCGASAWLPYLALEKGCRVTGLDYEPSAVELTVANMRGAGAPGDVLCRDAFATQDNADLADRFDLLYSGGLFEHFADVVARLRAVRPYLRPDGVILTTVPNFQGLNWALQRFGDVRVLETHVIYDVQLLRRRHEEAGYITLAAGYLGFYDGFVSATAPGIPRWRAAAHRAACLGSNLLTHHFARLMRERRLPDWAWFAPCVFYVGRRID
jgi:SAM-dependent methyltransferase